MSAPLAAWSGDSGLDDGAQYNEERRRRLLVHTAQPWGRGEIRLVAMAVEGSAPELVEPAASATLDEAVARLTMPEAMCERVEAAGNTVSTVGIRDLGDDQELVLAGCAAGERAAVRRHLLHRDVQHLTAPRKDVRLQPRHQDLQAQARGPFVGGYLGYGDHLGALVVL